MPKAFITDIDGTLTDDRRRLSMHAVEEIRRLVDAGIPVILASGNTVCFIDARYTGMRHAEGDRSICLAAYQKIVEHFQPKGEELRLYSNEYRYSDVAFARDVDAEDVSRLLAGMPVQVIDTGFAIHLQPLGLSKGAALAKLAELMGLTPSDFLAAGDSINDVSMLNAAGIAVVPANASPEARAAADHIMDKPFGEGTAEALAQYFP